MQVLSSDLLDEFNRLTRHMNELWKTFNLPGQPVLTIPKLVEIQMLACLEDRYVLVRDVTSKAERSLNGVPIRIE